MEEVKSANTKVEVKRVLFNEITKKGVADGLETEHGYALPRRMQIDFSKIVQTWADENEEELVSERVRTLWTAAETACAGQIWLAGYDCGARYPWGERALTLAGHRLAPWPAGHQPEPCCPVCIEDYSSHLPTPDMQSQAPPGRFGCTEKGLCALLDSDRTSNPLFLTLLLQELVSSASFETLQDTLAVLLSHPPSATAP